MGEVAMTWVLRATPGVVGYLVGNIVGYIVGGPVKVF
jgi:hypothetical protein